MHTTAQLGAALQRQLLHEEREALPITSQTNGNGDSHLPLLLSQISGKPVVNPNDERCQYRVLRAFWAKLQRADILSPDTPYRMLAVQVLEQAAELRWTADDLEAGCKRFQAAEQFGERIEIAKFFGHTAETLYPYSWVLEQVNATTAKFTDFDGYAIEGSSKLMWRRHDGHKLGGLRLVVWEGKTIAPVTPVEAVKIDALTGEKTEMLLAPRHSSERPQLTLDSVKAYAALADDNLALKAELAAAKRELHREREANAILQRRLAHYEQAREEEHEPQEA